MKIVHLADVHWRSLSRHKEYRDCFIDAFKKMRALEPDLILIAGDIVHSKTQGISPEVISNLTWWFRELSSISKVIVTLGNHDGLILNQDREDAISPIINALDDLNIKLYKKSDVYEINEHFDLGVFGCFDEENWHKVVPMNPNKINIATFHGSVHGSMTDEKWNLESSTKVSFFDKFDYVMLGDIHKQQFLTSKIAFCGSTIQQNYGEVQEKGFLFWDIKSKDDFTVKNINVINTCPFVTLPFTGLDRLKSDVKNYPPKSRFRLEISSDTTASEMMQIKSVIKDLAEPEEIVFKREIKDIDNDIQDDALETSSGVENFDAVNTLVKEFHQKSEFSKETHDEMTKSLLNAWSTAEIEENISSGKWSIKKIEFDNIFGYGEGNVVNFDSATGITGIFGKNRSGKSSICGALTYALFNGTDRGAMKSVHVVNTRKNHCRANVYLTKKGKNFLIERQSVKKSNNKNEINATTHLNMFECDEKGNTIKDLSDEQRRETEKVLREQIGTLDDFLLTSFASQGDVNRFIDLGSSARKAILAKFLRLDVLDTLHEQIKQELSVAKGVLSKIPQKDFDAKIKDCEQKIEDFKNNRISESEAHKKINEILNEISSKISNNVAKDMYTKEELEEQDKKIVSLRNDINSIIEQKNTTISKKNILSVSFDLIKKTLNESDYDTLIKTKEKINSIEKSLLVASSEADAKCTKIKTAEKEVKKLSDVPCGDTFPTCKYIISARNAEKSMKDLQDNLEETNTKINSLETELSRLIKENVDQKLSEKKTLDDKLNLLQKEIHDCDMSLVKIDSKNHLLERDLENAISLSEKMKLNLYDTEIVKQKETLLKKKSIAESKLNDCNKKIQSVSEKIGLLCAELAQIKNDKMTFEMNNQKVQLLSHLQRALCRDGIPLQIIKKKLPIINHEICNILQGVTGFTVELEADKNDGMEIMLNYGDSKRIIECCSGMEKMMASLAIRTALVRVSNLPKSDILIIDEGFGALDPSNIEACTSLLKSLTKTFKTILIISHVDTVKDIVDNVIEISVNNGHDAKVEFR